MSEVDAAGRGGRAALGLERGHLSQSKIHIKSHFPKVFICVPRLNLSEPNVVYRGSQTHRGETVAAVVDPGEGVPTEEAAVLVEVGREHHRLVLARDLFAAYPITTN